MIDLFRNVWTNSIHLLCQWHVQQAVWRWLWSADHHINKNDRPVLMNLFKQIMYAKSSEEFDSKVDEMYEDEIFEKYNIFKEHLERQYFGRKEKWTTCHRLEENLPTGNNNTNNYVEASFRHQLQ